MTRKKQITDLLSEDPKDLFLHFALAKELEKEGDWDQAITHYQFIKQLDNQYIGLYYHLGKAFEQVEDRKSAIAIYDDGIKIAEGLQDVHSTAELKNARMNAILEQD